MTTNITTAHATVPALALPCLNVDLAPQLVWKSIMVSKGAVKLSGLIWQVAGFEVGQPLKITEYANALAVTACDKSEPTFVLSGKSSTHAGHTFDLRNTVLDKSFVVRAVVLENQILLVTPMTALGKQCRPDREWPTSRVKLEFLTRVASERVQKLRQAPDVAQPVTTVAESETVHSDAVTVEQPEADLPVTAQLISANDPEFEERKTYDVRPNQRLQIQGRWLPSLGFKPGVKFSLAQRENALELTVADDGDYMVTEHSPGCAKLYVASSNMQELNVAKVKVLAKEGALRVVPATTVP